MKTSSRGLLIALVVLLVVAALIWLATRSEPVPPRVERDEAAPVRFEFAGIDVASPDLEVGPAEIKGTVYPSYSSWRVTMSCDEPDGCTGEFALEVGYHSGSESRRLVIINRCEAPMGQNLRFEGLQDQSTAIDGIDRVTLKVRDRRGFDQGPVKVPL
jgi:hypothetical protein